MGVLEKLEILGASAKFDTCASTASNRAVKRGAGYIGAPVSSGVCHSFLPDGRCVTLLKVLYTNKCIHDCKYCFNSTSSTRQRTSFEPQELTRLFMNLYLRNYVEGLFLSSGVCGSAEKTMEGMLGVVEQLRMKEHFEGYIHLKVLPSSPYYLIKEGSTYADRLSVNCEAPNKSRFQELSGTKEYKNDILTRIAWIKGLKKQKLLPAGHTTQFVVGGADEPDRELLKMALWLYENMDLNRSYYSAFSPIKGTPLENMQATPIKREHRLYQADWLLRKYNFKFSELELAFNDKGNIPITEDPKLLIAQADPDRFPLEINEASYEDLLHIPGIGPISARRIINLRKNQIVIEEFRQLANIGVVLKRARPYIKVAYKRQTQLDNFLNKNDLEAIQYVMPEWDESH
ncbi:MAG TPA: putative DNA modification/repair radical SAM protein [Candidatus Deferrimicrobium sp.]|nr:putative DNA modification/repair radical SAM protein [Candidatus Deferrimicrobium sp.]